MSVETVAAALGGLVVGYACHETSGTTLTDFSANSLNATVSTRGATNGAAVLPGSAAALRCNGDLGSGSVATRAVAGGSPLQISSALTVICCARPTSTNAITRGFGERPNNWQLRWTPAPNYWVQAFVTLGGVTSGPASGISAVVSGSRVWPWFTYDGKSLCVGVNDCLEDRQWMTGTITATTDTLQIGSVGSNGFIGEMEYFMIFNRALELGEIGQIVIEGDPTIHRGITVGEYAFWDHVADDLTPVASSTSNRVCAQCGGRMRSGEGNWLRSGGGYLHPGCMAPNATTLPSTVTSSSTQAEYAARAERLTRDVLQLASRRALSTRDIYFGAEGDFHNSEYAANTDRVVYNLVGIGVAAAALARYRRLTRRDPVTKAAVAALQSAYTIATTPATNPSVWWNNGDFTWSAVGKALILLKGKMDPGLWREWVDMFLQGVDDFGLGGTDMLGGPHGNNGAPKGGGSGWYTNGNRNADHVLMTWMAYYLDPTSTRLADYNAEKAWLDTPGTGLWSPGGTLPHGWVTSVAATQPDGSDGQGYWREAHNTTAKGFWNVGNTADGDSGYETVNVDGRCFTYLGTQTQTSTNLFLFSGENYWAQKANMCRNLLYTRVSLTTGNIDTTVSSRHCASYPWTMAADQALTWRGKRTAAINATDMASLWLKVEATYRSVFRVGAVSSYFRSFGRDMPALFMGLTDWPGH